MKKTLIAVIAATGIAVAGLIAADQSSSDHGPKGHGPGHHPHGPGGNPLEHVAKELNLTPEQQQKVAPIIEAAKPQIAAIHREAEEKTAAVMNNCADQIRPLLTPQQQAKLDAIKKAHEDMRKAHEEMEAAKRM